MKLNEKELAMVKGMRGWIQCIKALNKGHRRKNRLIRRLRHEIDRLNIELRHANDTMEYIHKEVING